ncbi:MAG: hypothetical protein PUH91_05495, partial [Prevotella sp.]|nr:hypothetical protein [Prevotella sp.]
WCFSPFPGLLRWGIKPAVDFAEARDTRGRARESASLHWILLQLCLRQRRNRCLDETDQIIPVIHIADVEASIGGMYGNHRYICRKR